MEIELHCLDPVLREHELLMKREYNRLSATRLDLKTSEARKKHDGQIAKLRDDILALISEDRERQKIAPRRN
jgi:hypothetical protein